MGERYVYDHARKKVVPIEEAPPLQEQRGGPHIIRDETDAFRSMADGKHYTSKSSYRRSLREQGMVEIGNERVEQRRPEPPSAIPDIIRHFQE